MIQLYFWRRHIKYLSLTPSVVRNPTATLPNNLRVCNPASNLIGIVAAACLE